MDRPSGVERREGSGHSPGSPEQSSCPLMGQGVRVRVGGMPRERAGSENILSQGGKSAEHRHEKPLRGEARSQRPEQAAWGLSHSLKFLLQRLWCRAVRLRPRGRAASLLQEPSRQSLVVAHGQAARIGLVTRLPYRKACSSSRDRGMQAKMTVSAIKGQLVLGLPSLPPHGVNTKRPAMFVICLHHPSLRPD